MAKPQVAQVAMTDELVAAEPAPAQAAAPAAAPAASNYSYATVAPHHGYASPYCDDCHKGHKHGGGTITGGLGFYYIQPHYETNPAYTFSITAQDGTSQVRQNDFDYDYDFAPILWLGWANCDGFGFRARTWWYENDASTQLTNDGTFSIDSAAPLGLQNTSTTAGDVLLFSTDIKIRVYDLEATQSYNVGGWNLLLAGGVRYAHLSQSYNHLEAPLNGQVDAISSGSTFKGFGPTVALEVRRDLGNTGLTIYGSARGSVLFGNSSQDSSQVVNNVPDAFASTSRDDVLPITELEIGAEWGYNLGRGRLFAQGALVGQVWHGAGNAAQNEMIPVLVDPEVSDNSSNLGLFGIKLAVGINY